MRSPEDRDFNEPETLQSFTGVDLATAGEAASEANGGFPPEFLAGIGGIVLPQAGVSGANN